MTKTTFKKNMKRNEKKSPIHDHIELTETVENYIKHIYFLVNRNGEARVSELSRVLNRSMSSVSEAIRRLQDQGLVKFQKYGKIELTTLGKTIGEKVAYKHNLLFEFLQLIGVEETIADSDACSMEHFIHEETVNALREFLSFMKSSDAGKHALREFQMSFD